MVDKAVVVVVKDRTVVVKKRKYNDKWKSYIHHDTCLES